LRALRGGGDIADDTLVWQEGMGDWKPFSEVLGAPAAGAAETVAAGEGEAGEAGELVGAGALATCAFSGKAMVRSEMIQYGDSFVAPEHKEAFVQRLKEGGDANASELQYAGFWMRVAAKMIDGLAIGLPLSVPYLLAYMKFISITTLPEPDPDEVKFWLGIVGVAYIFIFVGQIFYVTWMVGKFKATLGKMALGIQVVNADGSRVSYLKAFGRYWGEVVSYIIMGIGYILVAFDDEKRALHDHICATRVVKK